MLDDDSLLQIFSQYQLQHEENWNLRLMWRKPAHVCRRWRLLIYNSWSHLDMWLILRNHSLSIDTLSHLPRLPLVIDCSDKTGTITRKDEDNVHVGLQRHGRVLRATLRAPPSSLRMWLKPMNKLFPRLEDLSLFSTTIEEAYLMLPETLQAPNLRHLALHGIALPIGLPLLSSAIALSTLSLTHIGASCSFPPWHLVSQLRGLPHLEELSIGFATPLPLPSAEGEIIHAPIPPVILPALKRLTFRGVGVYLDNLVAQINAPLLERLSLTLFFQPVFTLVDLTEFIHRTEGFRCLVARVNFNKDGVSMDADHSESQGVGKLSLRVNCVPLDWQIDSATQVCGALGNVLSVVEDLTLDLEMDGMPSDWENTIDDNVDKLGVSQWHELLRQFLGVKKLHIGSSLTLELSEALGSVVGESVLELLPELEELEVHLEADRARKAFSEFVENRQSVGHPVCLLAAPISQADPRVLCAELEECADPDVPREDPQVPCADPGVPCADPEVSCTNPEVPRAYSEVHHIIDAKPFLKYMKYVGRPYRNQSMGLISICRTFLQAENQTFHSYYELRR